MAENLKRFWPNDLDRNYKPIIFTYEGREMIGYRAELLPDVCTRNGSDTSVATCPVTSTFANTGISESQEYQVTALGRILQITP